MYRTRVFILSLSVLLLAIGGRVVQHAIAAEEVAQVEVKSAKPQRPVSLRDRLVVGLQARLKSEVNFVEAVVAKVQAGELPQRQVDETFFWARQRAAMARDGRPHRPIIYFQPAMKARADRMHIAL